MRAAADGADGVNRLVELLQAGQAALLAVLHALGLAGDAHGQAAWPFAERIAVETLVIDGTLARQVVAVLAVAAIVPLFVLLGALWRRGRWWSWAAAALLLVGAPWPARSLVLTEAYPTSFHRSPSAFDASSIERGLSIYRSQCAECHGDDGRGEGPRAASLPMWPPRLDGELLWKRADGEVFWRILHGLRDRHGVPTMPGFDGRLRDDEVWALIDGTKALAAGESVRDEGAWGEPVRAPEVTVSCIGQAPRPLSAWRGQRLRIVAGNGAATPLPREDPRLVTLLLDGSAAGSAGQAAACTIRGADAYRAYARIAGMAPDRFAGAQLLVDRDGWLRALGKPGLVAWSESDMLCRSGDSSRPAKRAAVDGLAALIAAIDADPVRIAQLGQAHAQ